VHTSLGALKANLSTDQSMGSSGHKFVAHTKSLSPAAQVKDGGYGLAPHPLRLRLGQVFWPRPPGRRRLLTVRRVLGPKVIVECISAKDEPRATLSASRLLATRDDGQGRHYQFQGFLARRYATFACVWEVGAGEAVLCLPEWHPGRPVRIPDRLVPAEARTPGAWMRVNCDLSASSAGRLQIADLVATASPELSHKPALQRGAPRGHTNIESARSR
jgi:hypothetical protein